ncbi:MAG: metal-dependent transcriptional regulator [Myxococcales bacterium]|jgi:DtxR family Mn-dependent transcriptional regulator|nr:metal-dependent transcriptional regulator [Myxococcales bacterium]
MNAAPTPNTELTSALEDYLETIFELVKERKVARVKDIVKARNVKSASVIPALRRLADLGLIHYTKRESIDLTETGEATARRIYSRHKLLVRLFRDFLGMPAELALQDACAMEHNLSDAGVDHLVRFFEFLQSCPDGHDFIERFKGCALVNAESPQDIATCCAKLALSPNDPNIISLRQLKPGQGGSVIRIQGTGAIRQRILDMGIMPEVHIQLERRSPAGDPLWVRVQNSQISLRKKEADMILLRKDTPADTNAP